MSDDSISFHFQVIRRQIAALQKEGDVDALQKIDAALGDLHAIYEQMQTNLEANELIRADWLQQITQQSYHYHDLFQSAPIAYLITNASAVILEANQAAAQLLNTPHPYVAGRPLVLYVANSDRPTFYTRLSQLSQHNDTQVWQMTLCPSKSEPFTARWHIAIARNAERQIEILRIAIYDLRQSLQEGPSPFETGLDGLQNALLIGQQPAEEI